MRWIFALLLLASSVIACVDANDAVSYDQCKSGVDLDFGSIQTVTWTSKLNDPTSSIISYRFCLRRASDMRFATHMRFSLLGPVRVSRVFSICGTTDEDEKRHACIEQLAGDGCLSGSVVMRLPVTPNSPDGITRSEIALSEGPTNTIVRVCSV
jgi:hypothetical protein